MNLTNYNEKQLEAIKETEGPLLVLAGAGSGKTRVLTAKVAYLIEKNGILPENILAITFTNKAAQEMKGRIIDMLGGIAYRIQISTFHSFGLLLIKENYEKLGYKSNFTILDSDDTLTIIKKILKDMSKDPKMYNPKGIKNKISSAKNAVINPEEYEKKFVNTDYDQVVLDVFRKYESKLKVSNSFDFDDLLIKPITLFEMYPEILFQYQEKYRYILIDEYQDTNEAQYKLVKMLSKRYKNICVVGDESQSIYSFRGSDYRNILKFEEDFPTSKTILLEQNYRSTKTILDSANKIISNNKQKKDKKLWTENDIGNKISYYRANDEKDEAFYTANEIKKLINNGVSKDKIAVLYRTNAQSRTIEEAMLRENIPYRVIGSFYFYNRKEIKDLISYLKLLYNPYDDVSLTRIINVPKRGIGTKTIDNLLNKADLENKSIFEVIESGKELEFKKIIQDIINEKDNHTLTELVDLVLDKSGMRMELESEKTIDSEIRLENLDEFKSITRTFEEQNGIVSLEEFLDEISLVADITEHKNLTDVVTLMTVHSAKGLEFDYVFLIGLEEGIFPHRNSYDSNDSIEEERRLCYVAVTRACKELYLVNAKRRIIYGLDSINPPSRFISEIGEENLDIKNSFQTEEIKFNKSNVIDKDVEYNLGDHVEHDSFGEGVIVGIDKSVLTIAFNHQVGIKMLIKGHKSIKKIEKN
ncbi:MAG: UvrD-helicase domain-containing protein [Clostridium sp.]|nr:UvrD-helicase domain-containing protein [Clostridium sp.]MCM1444196.1 UvrD-helicase domain-containing protein [Candidatus Amulumruptor caecigallinarius]